MEDTTKSTRLEGYTSGVRSATWHPTGSLLVCYIFCPAFGSTEVPQATCTSDGKIIVWNMSEEQPVIEKTIEGVIPVVIDTEYVLPQYPLR